MSNFGAVFGLSLFGVLLWLGMYAFALWIVLQFYRALARIGEELANLREILRERLPPPEGHSGR
jgi:hypothetical protein